MLSTPDRRTLSTERTISVVHRFTSVIQLLRSCTQLKNVIVRTGKLQLPHAVIGINTVLNALLYYSLSSLEIMNFRKRLHYS